MARAVPEINSSSQADIAFMLLIFFLVTTTMDIDSGIPRMLPPMPEETPNDPTNEIRERNIFIVLINKSDKLLVEGEQLDIRFLRERVKEFFDNPMEKNNLSEKREVDVEFFGPSLVTKGVVSLQNDLGTSYGMYIKVQNEITAAVRELRDERAMQKWGKRYEELTAEQQDAIKKIHPNAISESEPKRIGGK